MDRVRILPQSLLAVFMVCAMPVYAQTNTPSADRVERGQAASERHLAIEPYIEANSIAVWQFSPSNDVVTYTQLAAGVDASLQERNSGGSVSVRYERNFAHQSDGLDSDSISGIARGYVSVVPRTLTIEAGALASSTRVDSDGRSTINPLVDDDLTTTTYSAYAGPNFQKRVGDVEVNANYRIGYTRVDVPDFVAVDGAPADIFDESVSHSASIRAGTRPNRPLPVGIGLGAGFYQEDISNLDQRVRDAFVRADVTVPVTQSIAVVGGVGLEDVEVSSRDAVRDGNGNPIVGRDGRYLIDEASPRVIAYDADGIIWDVGVIWRPSSRTELQANFGHRYDSETFYGNFNWKPSSRSNVAVAVYDGIQGFGGRLNNALATLPTDFEVIRDPVTGNITGCVNSLDGTGCLDGLLGSVRSSVFRGRGVVASYSRQISRMTASVGAGYDRRRFIGASGTVLELADGIVDESYYIAAGVSGPVGQNASFDVTTYANWYDSGVSNTGDVFVLGSSASYTEQIWRNLSARIAAALAMIDSDTIGEDITTASALLGLRYDF